jgi:DUF4097 and DUF4098 domain-containing protein YvlB
MTPLRKPLFVVAAFLLVTSIAYEAFTAFDLVATRTKTSNSRYPTGPDGQPIRLVTIDVAGSIGIVGRTSADQTITVKQTTITGLRSPSVFTQRSGDTLNVRATCPILTTRCSVDLDLRVPSGTELQVRSSGGAIRIRGMRADVDAASEAGGVTITNSTGRINIRSSAGKVTFANVGGSVEAHSSAGEVTGKNVGAANVKATSSAGAVRLAFSKAPTNVEVFSSAGSVTVGVPRNGFPYRLLTDGDATVDVLSGPDSDRIISARSTAGPVRVAYADTLLD